MRYWRLIKLFLLILPFYGAVAQGQGPLYRFSENKGQFPTHYQYQSLLPNGALFIGNSSLDYFFYAEEEYAENTTNSHPEIEKKGDFHIHKHHSKKESNVDAHFLRMSFVGAASRTRYVGVNPYHDITNYISPEVNATGIHSFNMQLPVFQLHLLCTFNSQLDNGRICIRCE